jgi:hypothetical protein
MDGVRGADMKAYEYLVTKQILWARRRGIRLGSQFRNASDRTKRDRGRKLFVYDLADNLFEPLTEKARQAFENGDGGELHADKPGEGNMYALHSSSAAACNLFHYWHRRNERAPLAAALGLPPARASRLCFETPQMRNTSVEHVTVNWHPTYTIRGGGAHGEGLSSVQSNGFDSGEVRQLVAKRKNGSNARKSSRWPTEFIPLPARPRPPPSAARTR